MCIYLYNIYGIIYAQGNKRDKASKKIIKENIYIHTVNNAYLDMQYNTRKSKVEEKKIKDYI